MVQCFTLSIAYSFRHQRRGYCRPGWGEERFYPLSSLSFLTTNPKYVLFTEVLTTSRTCLVNIIWLPDTIVEQFFAQGDLFTSIKPIKTWVVGKELAKCLGFGGQSDCRQEKSVQEQIDENIYIDYNQNNGNITSSAQRPIVAHQPPKLLMTPSITRANGWI